MQPLSAQDMLKVWELGQGQQPWDRALTILSVAAPATGPTDLAALDIAQRDALLLDLREMTFGAAIKGFSQCPRCSAGLEFATATAEFRMLSNSEKPAGCFELTTGDLHLQFRLPNSADLAAAAGLDINAARTLIRQRCLIAALFDGSPVSAADLPEDSLEQLAARMAACSRQADINLEIHCPACGHQYQALFDIVAFFWTEISARAKRLLREVHTLARAYGWPEADILAMTSTRRAVYLEMVSS